ncbi:MAG TPA: hypothetical protein VJ941_12555, partial [Gracilimonas sp.]|nr:hypothetical protein [Gracilimonas sp.]
ENMAAVQMGGDWFYVNKNSKLVSIAKPFDGAESFKNGIARVWQGSDDDIRYGYINNKGEYIWYPTQ